MDELVFIGVRGLLHMALMGGVCRLGKVKRKLPKGFSVQAGMLGCWKEFGFSLVGRRHNMNSF